MKKALLSLLIMFLPMLASADPVEIDGITYNLISKGGVNEAEVTLAPNIREVVIPEKIEYEGVEYVVAVIGRNSFSNLQNIQSVTIPKTIRKIREYAFVFNYTNFYSSVHISDIESWMNIDFESYYSNPLYLAHHLYLNGVEVKDIVIPEGYTSIGNYVFDGLEFNSVTIPKTLTYIGESAFQRAKNVYISDLEAWCKIKFENVGSNPLFNIEGEDGGHLFCNGVEITTLKIPESVNNINDYAFFYCRGITSLIIPNGVQSIGYQSFYNCTGLASVSIPQSVTSIKESAFGECTSLLSVTIPNNVTTISSGSFAGCTSLESVYLPNGVLCIEGSAFASCKGLTSVTIPNSVTSIEGLAFGNCPGLSDVYCLAESVPSTSIEAFKDSYIEYATLHVPAASLETYSSTPPWNQFNNVVALIDEEIPETPKCATPEISYENGRVKFTCETQDVEFISNVILADDHSYYDDEIQLSQKYKISVYAAKAGYENSDETTREIEIKGDNKPIVVGDVDGDGKVNVADHVKLSDIILNK